MKNLRLIPVVMIAGVSLLGLKVAGLVDGAGTSGITAALAQTQPEPTERRFQTDDVPGLPAGTLPPAGQRGYVTHGNAPAELRPDSFPTLSPAERALLERLGERREELDAREAALAGKEALLMAAEARIAERVKELEALEARVAALTREQDEKRKEQLAGLVVMYENMRPKDAARIFDRLSLDVLLGVVEEMKPRVMSAILAQMEPQNAERLTHAIARRNAADQSPQSSNSSTELPQIGG